MHCMLNYYDVMDTCMFMNIHFVFQCLRLPEDVATFPDPDDDCTTSGSPYPRVHALIDNMHVQIIFIVQGSKKHYFMDSLCMSLVLMYCALIIQLKLNIFQLY